MPTLPEPKPTATAAGQDRDALIDQRADQFLAAINDAAATYYRDDRAVPKIGTAQPVPQPGIPPQSRAAVDYAVRVLSTSVATALVSGSISLVMVVSHWADPVVCGIVFGAPIGLAVPIAALSSLAGRAKQVVEAAPPEIHNHYNGPVHQDQRRTESRNTGIWVKNDNRQ